jgi:3-hydroxyacyl-[acyl-carrier-protein] dehydratase
LAFSDPSDRLVSGNVGAWYLAVDLAAEGRLSMRYLLLDRITVLEPPELGRAVKSVSLSDDVFVDHFPGHPVMPGALMVESLAQLGGVLLEAAVRKQGSSRELHAILTIIERAKFRRMVKPGDRLLLEATVVRASEDGGQVRGVVRVDAAEQAWQRVAGGPGGTIDEPPVAVEAELTFALAPVTNVAAVARRRQIVNTWLHGSDEEA